jgi:hypothetical protein
MTSLEPAPAPAPYPFTHLNVAAGLPFHLTVSSVIDVLDGPEYLRVTAGTELAVVSFEEAPSSARDRPSSSSAAGPARPIAPASGPQRPDLTRHRNARRWSRDTGGRWVEGTGQTSLGAGLSHTQIKPWPREPMRHGTP